MKNKIEKTRTKENNRKKLKILQAMHFPLEGAGTGHYVHNLSSGLIKQGHKVGAVYAHSPNCTRQDTPYERFPVNFSTNDLAFQFPVFESHPLSDGQNFGSFQGDNLCKYQEAFEHELDKAIDTMRPDVVNVHHGWILSDILSRKGIPYFVTLHGTELTAFNNYPQYQKAALDGLKGAQGIITLTNDQKQKAIDAYHINPGKFSVITTGIDRDFFKPSQEHRTQTLSRNGVDINKDQPVVLYVGRLTEVKGVEYLVDAAIHLQRDSKETPKILVVGDGVLRKQLTEVKERHNLSDLEFLGQKSSQEIKSLYNAADLVVVPSLNECFPLVPPEAMACATPFIGTNIPGGLEMQTTELENIVNNKSKEEVSLRVPVKDSDALASKMVETLRMKLKANIGKSIRTLSKKYSLTGMIENTTGLYDTAA